ncbi:MAG: hypothetical protein SVV80_07605 [Planctomycetota bacterium]|nr:hypothetical protein [Planctomycetota bacterium]
MMKDNPIVAIVGAIGAFSVAIVALFCVFIRQHLWPTLPATVGVLALMGIVMGYLAKARKDYNNRSSNDEE